MEIGSEFWKNDEKFIQNNEECFLLGRTALDAIIRDILAEHRITSVLLPSYACHTMIEPFKRNRINVRFYDVFIECGILVSDVPEPQEKEIFYAMSYFGDKQLKNINLATQDWRKLWGVSIEDTTHSCFHGSRESRADYEYSSCRKWMALDGLAIAKKKSGEFSIKGYGNANKTYIQMRNKAFGIKSDFMNGGAVPKSEFLELFRAAEECITEDYVGYRPDMSTVIRYYIELQNIARFIKKRRENAEVLMEGIKDIPEITVLLEDDAEACPLFVPIAVPENIRDDFRKHLINHEIYCPIHWPISTEHVGISDRAREVYGRELSLICDQRYGADDMEREIQVIKDYFLGR